MTIAKSPTFIDVPKQVNNDCGFFAVKFFSTYDGDELVDDFGDVEVCFVLVLVYFPVGRLLQMTGRPSSCTL